MPGRNVHQRLAAAMAECTYVQKETKKGMNYSIVTHDAVTAKVRPALLNAGIVYYPVEMGAEQDGDMTKVMLKVRFSNVDDPADYFDVPALGYGIDKQDKGPGKAISYAVKYALLKAMGLETGEDADLDNVERVEPCGRVPQHEEVVNFEKLIDEAGSVKALNAIFLDHAQELATLNETNEEEHAAVMAKFKGRKVQLQHAKAK